MTSSTAAARFFASGVALVPTLRSDFVTCFGRAREGPLALERGRPGLRLGGGGGAGAGELTATPRPTRPTRPGEAEAARAPRRAARSRERTRPPPLLR